MFFVLLLYMLWDTLVASLLLKNEITYGDRWHPTPVHFFEKDLGLCSFDVEQLLIKALSSMVKSNGFNYEVFENPEGYSKTIDVFIPIGMFTDKF